MARSIPLVSTIFVVLLLLVATEMGPMVAEARTCSALSHRYRGPCVRGRNCASVCQTEGFPDGDCDGFRRRCFCKRPC